MIAGRGLRAGWLINAFIALGATGCAPSGDDEGLLDESGEEVRGTATLTFASDGSAPRVAGTLAAGGRARITYSAARLTACRGTSNGGGAAWTITGYYRLNGGDAQSFPVAGASPTGGRIPVPVIELAAPGTLEVWFQNSNRWGCNGYDSNFGGNYRFEVQPDPRAPGWVGNAASVISRATCAGGPCEGDFRALEGGFRYDTWARERAAIRAAYFEVWKAGVTDRDNPDLWRALDVRVHYRFSPAGAFRTSYVNFDRRAGNNARYALDLRAVDPFAGPATPTGRAACPAATLSVTPDGQYVSAAVEFYFSVNGTELRPSAGATFRGTFETYRAPYAVCLAP